MIFYGTSAAEGIPSPFCDCRVCNNAREKKGDEIRRRSMFRINEESCIDLGADSLAQAIDYGDFIHLKNVFVTHTHDDHLCEMMMDVRNMAIARDKSPLNYYLVDEAFDIVEEWKHSRVIAKGQLNGLLEKNIVAFHKLEFFETYTIDGLDITPYKGNHQGNIEKNSANFLIKLPSGKTMYYGLDTGWYLPETFAHLQQVHIDLLISECTFGLTPRETHPGGHLDAASCMELFHTLLAQGTITPKTKIILTHINHYTSTGAELSAFFAAQEFPCEITLAHDGYTVET